MDMEIPDDIVVLTSEPIPNTTIEQLKSELQKHPDEQTLACVYAGVSNKVSWLIGNWDDDCDSENSPQFREWENFEESLQSSIFDILQKESDWLEYRASLENKGYYWQTMPFMERNGFCGKGGWWIPKDI